jgi:hypothetical protein
MSTLGKVARGLLSGAAGYYGKVAEQDEYDRRTQALADREMALKHLDSQLTEQRAARQALLDRGTNRQRIQDQGDEDIRGAPYKAASQMAVDSHRAGLKQDEMLADYAIWLKKQPVELQNKLTLQDFMEDRQDKRTEYIQGQETGRTEMHEGREDKRQERRLGEDVVATGVDANGNTVVAKGNDSHVTFRGMKPTPRVDPLTGNILGGGSTGQTAPAPQAAPSEARPKDKTYTASEFNEAVAAAAMDPRYRGMSGDEVRKLLKQRLKDQGYSLTQ